MMLVSKEIVIYEWKFSSQAQSVLFDFIKNFAIVKVVFDPNSIHEIKLILMFAAKEAEKKAVSRASTKANLIHS